MNSKWVKATLADDDPAVRSEKEPAGAEVFINLDLVAPIYRSNGGGSYVWFSADLRDSSTRQPVEWEGYVSVKESPETLLSESGNIVVVDKIDMGLLG